MDTKKLKHLYENTDMTQREIGKALGFKSGKAVFNYCVKNYSSAYRKARQERLLSKGKQGPLNPMFGKCGEEHPRFKGAVSDNKGYWMVLKPDWYTGRRGSKHVFLHSVVVCERLGWTEIPRGWCVHHCDSDPSNNDFDNLVAMTIQEHGLLHVALGGVTTISKESTLKWVEAHRAGNSYDIVCSA